MIRILQTEVWSDQIDLHRELKPIIHFYENPNILCPHKSSDPKYDMYVLFYQEYMLNHSMTITLDVSDEQPEEETEEMTESPQKK